MVDSARPASGGPLLEQLAVLSDATRCRLLRVLESEELTVGELCTVLELPQSTASRHLKQLTDSGWLQVRQDGNRRFYRVEVEPLAPRERRLWLLLRGELDDGDADFRGDQRRLQSVMSQRRATSENFFSASAGEWDTIRTELFGERFDLLGLLGLLDPDWVVGDLGCGTGALSATLAPFVHQVIGVDASSEMLDLAASRVAEHANVDLRSGMLEDLPLDSGVLDAGILFLVLQYTASPASILEEARRVLKPSAPLLIVDLQAHDDDDLRQRMGHLRQGFSRQFIEAELVRTGFDRVRWVPIQSQPRVKTPRPIPGLFSVTARSGTESSTS